MCVFRTGFSDFRLAAPSLHPSGFTEQDQRLNHIFFFSTQKVVRQYQLNNNQKHKKKYINKLTHV